VVNPDTFGQSIENLGKPPQECIFYVSLARHELEGEFLFMDDRLVSNGTEFVVMTAS
jgi:hypothetical protein